MILQNKISKTEVETIVFFNEGLNHYTLPPRQSLLAKCQNASYTETKKIFHDNVLPIHSPSIKRGRIQVKKGRGM